MKIIGKIRRYLNGIWGGMGEGKDLYYGREEKKEGKGGGPPMKGEKENGALVKSCQKWGTEDKKKKQKDKIRTCGCKWR